MDTSIAATLLSLQLCQQETHVQQLLTHSSDLLDMVTMLQAFMGERGVAPPEGLKVRELEVRHRKLRTQVQAEKQMPLLSKTVEVTG